VSLISELLGIVVAEITDRCVSVDDIFLTGKITFFSL